jgi:hypothetical protein
VGRSRRRWQWWESTRGDPRDNVRRQGRERERERGSAFYYTGVGGGWGEGEGGEDGQSTRILYTAIAVRACVRADSPPLLPFTATT